MRSILNTIPFDEPFMYERQGYYGNYIPGTPIADGSNLLPFYSKPYNPITLTKVEWWITSVCGSYTQKIGFINFIDKNGKWTFYHDGSDTGVSVPMGYYYVEVFYFIDDVKGEVFKTEPFWMPDANQLPEKKGSFNQSFDISFDK